MSMGQHKILVADDSLTIQKVIRLALSNEDYEIQAVSSGLEAGEQISLFRPDVVLMDVGIPGKSAFDIKKEVGETDDLKHVKFILMSSAFEQVDEDRVEQSGFDGRLIKPFDPAHLRKVITEALGASGAPSVSFSNDLWENESSPPPFESPAFSQMESDPDADIRTLTESTIKLSGMEDSEWSIDDHSIRENTSSEPQTMGDETMIGIQYQEPTLPPTENMKSTDDFEITPPPFQQNFETSIPLSSQSTFTKEETEAETIGLSSHELEKIISQQVQEKLENVLQRILPDIAERVIKEEIHKLLSDPPR